MLRALAMMLGFAAMLGTAAADPVADFYRGNSVRFLIGSGAGGGSDLAGRIIAHHLGRHLPGKPNVVVQNMPGGGGIVMTNHLYNVAPQDGTVIAFALPGIIEAQLLYAKNVKYDGRKMNWIGTASRGTGLLSVMRPAPAENLEQAKTAELIIGTTGPGSGAHQMPIMVAKLLGLKLKIVAGYQGGNSISLAMERGEVHGRVVGTTSWVAQHSAWLKEGRLAHIIQIGPKDKKNFPDVPALRDVVTDPRQQKLLALLEAGPTAGWTLMMGPGVPKERLAAARKAFSDMVSDPEFISTMEKKAEADVDPMLADELTTFVGNVLSTPADIVEEAKSILEIK
jgi:tripartite-type tricarboxylate transporter receptor subunit TctC